MDVHDLHNLALRAATAQFITQGNDIVFFHNHKGGFYQESVLLYTSFE